MQGFNQFCPPLPGRILAGSDPDFLSGADAFGVAFVVLAGWDALAKDDYRMGNLHPAQHAVLALDKDPSWGKRLIQGRINHLAAKGAIHGWGLRAAHKQRQRETHGPGNPHPHSDAKLQGGVHPAQS